MLKLIKSIAVAALFAIATTTATAAPLNLVQPADGAFVSIIPVEVDYVTGTVPAAAEPLDDVYYGTLSITAVNKSQFITENNTNSTGIGNIDLTVVLQHSDINGPLASPIAVYGTLLVDNTLIFAGNFGLGGQTLFNGDQLKPYGPGGAFGYSDTGKLEFIFAQDGNIPGFALNDAPIGVVVPLLMHGAGSSGTENTLINFTETDFFTFDFNSNDTGKADIFAVPAPTTSALVMLGLVAMLRRRPRSSRAA